MLDPEFEKFFLYKIPKLGNGKRANREEEEEVPYYDD